MTTAISKPFRAVLVGCALGASALASAASHDIKTFIVEYDLDHDGAVSKDEFAQERDRRFASTDADHSGGLSHDEYVEEYRGRFSATHPDARVTERQTKQTEVRFKVLDSNHNGQISPAEYAHSGWSMFTRHDYTNDGAVSARDDVEPKGRDERGKRDNESAGQQAGKDA